MNDYCSTSVSGEKPIKWPWIFKTSEGQPEVLFIRAYKKSQFSMSQPNRSFVLFLRGNLPSIMRTVLMQYGANPVKHLGKCLTLSMNSPVDGGLGYQL